MMSQSWMLELGARRPGVRRSPFPTSMSKPTHAPVRLAERLRLVVRIGRDPKHTVLHDRLEEVARCVGRLLDRVLDVRLKDSVSQSRYVVASPTQTTGRNVSGTAVPWRWRSRRESADWHAGQDEHRDRQDREASELVHEASPQCGSAALRDGNLCSRSARCSTSPHLHGKEVGTHRYTPRMTSTVPTTPLSRASTMPKRYYLDPDVLELEKERIFGSTWQLVARTDELQRIGDFVPVTVLDEPIVITRGLERELRAFYNVCRHRAGQVALTKGNRKSLQCRYHGWTYGLDGCLRAAPEMEDTEGFSKDDFGLMPVRVDTWGPFVFVNLSDSRAAPRRGARRDPLRGRRGRLRRRAHAARRAARLRHRVQLEGLRRQLPRGLSPADRASAAIQGARLRLLPRRGVPLLLEAARTDSGAEAGRGARGRSALPPPARRRGLGPLLLALPEHDVQHLPGQHVLERHPAARRRTAR